MLTLFSQQKFQNFYYDMLLQEFYRVFGAYNFASENIKNDNYIVKYLFYYIEENNEIYIFTFQFKKQVEGEKFLLKSVKKTPFSHFYRYENIKNSILEDLNRIVILKI